MSGFIDRGRLALALGVLGATMMMALAVGLPAAGVAAHRSRPRPDLKVSKGSVRAAHGRLMGSFVVLNAGRSAAAPSSAGLSIRVGGNNRLVRSYSVPKLKRSASHTVKVSSQVPSGLPAGSLAIVACADAGGKVRERPEANNCRTVGTVRIRKTTTTTTQPVSSVPTAPVTYTADAPFEIADAQSDYWVNVPKSYDATNQTPITLFVWLHGCAGYAKYDIAMVDPGADRAYVSIAVGGQEGNCWDVNNDGAKVLAAIADVKTHFNINPRRVILGGYSSGGDLAYRTIFYNADAFAGLLAENTSPFRDTGSTQAQSLAAAAWKFNAVQLAHVQDAVYPVAGVTSEVNAMKHAGFPITLLEQPGDHYDDAGQNGYAGTANDLVTYLLPHIDDGWLAPAP